IGFAVPVEIAKNILPDLISYGRVLRPWLGIATRSITPQLASRLDLGVNKGLIITGVLPDGPAGRAGIKGSDRVSLRNNHYHLDADVLTRVDNHEVHSEEDLYRALNGYKPNDVVQVEIYRDKQPMKVNVKLEAKPQQYNR